MVKLSSKSLVVALGGLALSLTAGASVASADPLVDTTCTYPQVIAALNAQDPALAQTFSASPLASSTLSRFLAAGTGERQQIVDQLQGSSLGQRYIGPIMSIANTCNNY